MRHVRRPQKGYVLLIVLVVGIAASFAAASLITSAGGGEIVAIHSQGGDLSAGIAQAGMARAEAYLNNIVVQQGDFDRALDPDLDTSCTSTPIAPDTDDDNTPDFSDGARVSLAYLNNKRFTRVEYNGGAYFVRFDDDDDDLMDVNAWRGFTGNNEAGYGCFEGDEPNDGVGTGGLNEGSNPVRDRNRAIWVSVIGIHPGTNAENAKHRTVLRQYVAYPPDVPGQPGFQVQGLLRGNGGGVNITLGSSVDDVGAGAGTRIQSNGSSNICSCGPTSGAHAVQSVACASAVCGTNTYEPTAVTYSAPVNIAPANDSSWFDWTSACNFYIDPGNPEGVFFWDAGGTRGPGACESYGGNVIGPSRSPGDWGSCWVPLIFQPSDGAVPNDPCDFGEVGSATSAHASWVPRNAADTANNNTCGTYYYSSLPAAPQKPNWATECARPLTSPSGFEWNAPHPLTPPAGTHSRPSCTACDGTTAALTFDEDRDNSGAGEEWEFTTNAKAVPTGVFYYPGNYRWRGGKTNFTTVPSGMNDVANWPMYTFLVRDNLTIDSGAELALGVGTRIKGFTSLVANQLYMDDGKLYLAGSMWMRGLSQLEDSDLRVHGLVGIAGDFDAHGTCDIVWDYDYNLDPSLEAAIDAAPPPPAISRVVQ